jgi:hypothetical protein
MAACASVVVDLLDTNVEFDHQSVTAKGTLKRAAMPIDDWSEKVD